MGTGWDARNIPVGKDENGIDGVNVIPDLRLNPRVARLAGGRECELSRVCREREPWEDGVHTHAV